MSTPVDYSKANIVFRDALREARFQYGNALANAVYAMSFHDSPNFVFIHGIVLAYDIALVKVALIVSKARHSYYLFATASSDKSKAEAKDIADRLDVEAAESVAECARLQFIVSKSALADRDDLRVIDIIVGITNDAVENSKSPEEAANNARYLCASRGVTEAPVVEAIASASSASYGVKVSCEVCKFATDAENYYADRTKGVFSGIITAVCEGATSHEDAATRASEKYLLQARDSRERAVSYNSPEQKST